MDITILILIVALVAFVAEIRDAAEVPDDYPI